MDCGTATLRLRSFLINLDRSVDRLAAAEAQFRRLGVAFTRIAAVDGETLDADVVQSFTRRTPPNQRPWKPGEIGCFLSHIEAWRRIAAGPEAAGAVFEDDACLASDIGRLLASNDWIPADADVVRLEGMGVMKLERGRRIRGCKGRRVQGLLTGTWGTAGYVISKHAAARLLQVPQSDYAPVDLFLFEPRISTVAAGLRRYQVNPSACLQDQFRSDGRAGFCSLIHVSEKTVLPKPKSWNPFSLIRARTKVTVRFRM